MLPDLFCHYQIATLPLDTAKVRLQLQAKSEGVPKYKYDPLRWLLSMLISLA